MDPKLLITLLLILINGFFVAAEFALVKTRSAQLELAHQKGATGSANAKRIISRLDTYLSACQLGITLASLLIGWLGEETMTAYLLVAFDALHIYLPDAAVHTIAVATGFVIITGLHIVIGEQLPKIIGITYPLKTTLFIADPLAIFHKIFGPFVQLLNRLANSAAKVLGLKPMSEEESHSEEEIKMIITESEEDGKINENERELIQNVFDFDNHVIRKVMTPVNQMVAIDIEDSLDTQVKTIIEEGYSRIPVYEDNLNNIVGIVYSKDVLKAIYYRESTDIKEFVRPVHFVPEHKLVIDLLHDFQAKKYHIAVVIDEFGNTLGLVTMEDLLEDLVGNIEDEHDEDELDIVVDNEGNWVVKSHTLISDINEVLPHPLPESEKYDTVSGYINMLFDHIPQTGEEIVADGYRISILQSKRQTSELIKLQVAEE